MSHDRRIEREAVYPHPPERVWRALVDPNELSAWLMPTDFAPEVGRDFVLETRQEHRQRKGDPLMKTPPIVSAQEWDAALAQMLVKEKELTRARDALAAERRRMPWLAVEKEYSFEGPNGTRATPRSCSRRACRSPTSSG